MNIGDYRSIAVSSIRLKNGRVVQRRKRLRDPRDIQRILDAMPDMSAAESESSSGSMPCSVGDSRLIVTLHGRGGVVRNLQIRQGLVYEDGRFIGKVRLTAASLFDELLDEGTEGVVNPAAELLGVSTRGAWRR
ncbi:MAG: hypothetical protein ACYC5Q_16770 [Thermoleophilia bacterium]